MTGHDVTMTGDQFAELKARVGTLFEMAEYADQIALRDAAADVYDLLVAAETDDGPIPVAAGQLSLLDWLHDGGAS